MELEGTVTGGMFVPDAGTPSLQEGNPGWFMDLIRDLIVDNPDSPGDLAIQHDHYRLGTPKR